MRRADRLFLILQYLRGGRLTTAAALAERLEVSPRTIYRDVADLIGSGVPIEGEAGVGYLMREGYDLPPLMFTEAEVAALVAGARMVRAWGGAEMALAAEEALVKIAAVLPPKARGAADAVPFHAIAGRGMTDDLRARLDLVQGAIDGRLSLAVRYRDEAGQETARDVLPLGLFFWGGVWTLVGWCMLRDDFRTFRLDRMTGCDTGAGFRLRSDQSLHSFLKREAAAGHRVDPLPSGPGSG